VIAVGGIAPHGEIEGELAAAMEELARRVADAKPETIVVATPHSVHVERHFAVVTAARVGAWETDGGLAAAALASLADAGIPAVGVSFGGNDPGQAELPADWGTEVPLRFLPRLPVVVVSPARDRPLEEHVRAGAAIAHATENRRVAFVASADHGHAHDAAGPYGSHEAAARYDALVQELVRGDRLERWPELAALVDDAKADSLWQLLLLHGALGGQAHGELLAYACPSYYGMLVAAYEP
jgi:aromatic ring-opening dioxygenase LigB subunit